MAKLSQAEKMLEELRGKVDVNNPEATAGGIKVQQDVIAGLRDSLDEVKGSIQEFHSAWEPVAQDLAGKFPEVRVFLSLDDPGGHFPP